jgi:maltose alpha-D-glucosyltransferase/alpha-amylase
MLRSFNYVRWSALRRVARDAGEFERLAPAAREWESATRRAFLESYAKTIAPADRGPAIDMGLLGLFEIEKALYELRYELNNRIDWAQVPLHGVRDLLDGRGRR